MKKNIRPMLGKPLLLYSLDFARMFAGDEDICISTDSEEIAQVAEMAGYHVPFIRPDRLARDESPMQDVILHALKLYESQGKKFEAVFLLQPTSPIRLKEHGDAMISLYEELEGTIDLVASVGLAKRSPYFNLFEDSGNGRLVRMKTRNYLNRQACPDVFYLNGSMYIYNVASLLSLKTGAFKNIRKFAMNEMYSIDIDSELDWMLSEAVMKKNKLVPSSGD